MSTFTTLQCNAGEIKVRSNASKRTYTIITTNGAKYRTYPMSKDDFNNASYMTGNDWANFLKSNDYYAVK
jgi:hypothetical protein